MIRLDIKHSNKLLNNLKKYQGQVVYGVPRSTAYSRQHDNKDLGNPTYNNAEILALMERGSIINQIPSRQLLTPVRKKYSEQINKALKEICGLLLQGKQVEADTKMEQLAVRIENWTKKFFTDGDNGWEPNAYITIHGGWMKNKVSGKPVYIKGKHSERPLIDTGSLRQSIKAIYYKDAEQ